MIYCQFGSIIFAKSCSSLFHSVIDSSPLILVQHHPSDFQPQTSVHCHFRLINNIALIRNLKTNQLRHNQYDSNNQIFRHVLKESSILCLVLLFQYFLILSHLLVLLIHMQHMIHLAQQMIKIRFWTKWIVCVRIMLHQSISL